ncbi:hypothetical protein SERLADRAFT_458529 [Serpula lacrymans var. lacrymans S7.9]|uniref:Uncharacterized protein n=1 Tax=Serpula lacrymans var. lacrymans (strain S7.9) TaxID=578457 RepID=F8NJK0_SERL9|nr:uncharacterized protein SERLADRAFT_458529 [Serpula lacrymans var. lacrymans S7.9]EGO30050.1 hypothetical protein SERLADRAFT_458529 [Serpula lacrymans var. lacrymans S7.9]
MVKVKFNVPSPPHLSYRYLRSRSPDLPCPPNVIERENGPFNKSTVLEGCISSFQQTSGKRKRHA